MDNSNKGQIKKLAMGVSVAGIIALLSTTLNTSFGADNTTPTANKAATISDVKATTIDEILVSDEPNKDGYVLQAKTNLPVSAAKIYATVQLGRGVEGSKVMATLTHVESGAKIGPVVATVSTTGDTMEAFSFTNTSMPWLKGKYQVDVSISNGASKSVFFNVGD